MQKEELTGLPQGARRQLASPRVLQWSASGRIAPKPSLLNARKDEAIFIVAPHRARESTLDPHECTVS